MKCKLCHQTAVLEKGWFNIAAFMYPLCKEHIREYWEYKNGL